MKRQAEFLVEKRDGRTEWLRATKLARSVHLALRSSGVDEDWRALEVANAVLIGLRQKRAHGLADGASLPSLSTTELADAVQHVLVATGHPAAAAAFGAVGCDRHRRRAAFASIARQSAAAAAGPQQGGDGARRVEE